MSAANARAGWPFWVIGILALLWNAMGAFDYLATKLRLEFYVSNFTPEQMEYFYGIPAWMTAGWALGVWGAFVGSILLLMRKSWAVWSFAISLLGLAVSTLYNFVLTDGMKIMGTAGAVFTAVIWVIAIFLLVYARRQATRGVLA